MVISCIFFRNNDKAQVVKMLKIREKSDIVLRLLPDPIREEIIRLAHLPDEEEITVG